MSTPWKRCEVIGDAVLYLGDCREILPTLERIDAIIADPPYSSGGFQEGGRGQGSIGQRNNPKIMGDVLSTRGYMRLIKGMCASTLADEFFIFTDWRMWISACDAMEDGGVRIRDMIVWDKIHFGMGVPWRSQHELIAYGKRTPASGQTGKHGNVINLCRAGTEHHPTEKPVELVEVFLRNSLAQIVCDPFMGSGTTGVACVRLNRSFIGMELDPKHFDTACRRIDEAQRQGRLFDPPRAKSEQMALLP